MKVAIFGSPFQSEKLNQVWSVFNALNQLNAEVFVCRSFYDFLTTTLLNPPVVHGVIDGEDFTADFALSIGGDGTYLRTAHQIGNKNIPILGINTGRLGYLAEVDAVEIDSVISDLFQKNYRITNLSQMHLSIDGHSFAEYPCALNEIAILKRDSSSMINIHASVNGEYLNSYQADGLLLSTPTGSTAYGLSVGGPIIMPDSKCLLVAPVAPHNLSARPLVLDETSVIDLEVESRSNNFQVSLDGCAFTMPCTVKLQVTKADYCVKAIKLQGHSYFQTLRKKLMWGLDPRS